MDYDFISGQDDFIFFLHGWGADKNSFKLVINNLKENLVFVSFAGFGASKIEKPYTLEDYANELRELILKIAKGKSVNIVCHSFGARVAAKLISETPDIIKKLVIVDGAGIKPRHGLKYYLKIFKYKRLKKQVMKGKKDRAVLNAFGSSDYKALSPIMKQTFVNIVNERLENCFRKIKCPTIMFWGDSDRETPLYMAKKMKKLISNSAIILAKRAGHFSFADKPGLFIAVLQAFIEN